MIRCTKAVLAAAVVITSLGIATQAKADMWNWSNGGGSGPWTANYDGPAAADELNITITITNFVATEVIGMEFTILPESTETYTGAAPFSGIVFDITDDGTPDDVAPFIPPSSSQTLDGAAVLSTPSGGFANQMLTYNFTGDPLAFSDAATFQFQIERPLDGGSGKLFDIRISTIIPEPTTVALLGLGGLALLRRR